jgi:uncharacterized protein with PIN domain
MRVSFIADVHLGKLAKLLRMLGFDCLYHNNYTNQQLINIAAGTGRVLLTRNSTLSRSAFFIESEDAMQQLKQTLTAFPLVGAIKPFTRCIVCNESLQSKEKAEVEMLLKRNTAIYYNQFWQCKQCQRIYWKGSHYEKMKQQLEELLSM